MRNLKYILAAAIFFVASASAANAQLVDGTRISVSVPNAFVLRDKTFPAGEYTIERTPSTIDAPSVLIIRGEDETMVFDTVKTESYNAAKSTQLVFDTVGGTSYLTGIVVRGSTARNDVPRTKRFKQALNEGVASRTYLTITDASL